MERILGEAELLPRQPAGHALAIAAAEATEPRPGGVAALGDVPGLLAVFRRGIAMLREAPSAERSALQEDLDALDRATERLEAALGSAAGAAFLVPGFSTATLCLAERLYRRPLEAAVDPEAGELGQLLLEAAPTIVRLICLAGQQGPAASAPAPLQN